MTAGQSDGGTGPLPSGRAVIEAGIRRTLAADPAFTPSDEQMARYEKLRLPEDLIAELRRRHQAGKEGAAEQE